MFGVYKRIIVKFKCNAFLLVFRVELNLRVNKIVILECSRNIFLKIEIALH
jgi:hypothetical protein